MRISDYEAAQRLSTENDRLKAINAKLLEASEAMAELLGFGDMDAIFEKLADEFYRDTGYLRPGKDAGPLGSESYDRDRREAWSHWQSEKIADGRVLSAAAIAAARQ